MAGGIKVCGKKIILDGVLNLENMSLENGDFSEPINIKEMLDKEDFDFRTVKVTFQEVDKIITEEELLQSKEDLEMELGDEEDV